MLRFNGSLWCFAWPRGAAYVETELARRFHVLNNIVWAKPSAYAMKARKEELRSFLPLSERIIFAEHYGAYNKRSYRRWERRAARRALKTVI